MSSAIMILETVRVLSPGAHTARAWRQRRALAAVACAALLTVEAGAQTQTRLTSGAAVTFFKSVMVRTACEPGSAVCSVFFADPTYVITVPGDAEWLQVAIDQPAVVLHGRFGTPPELVDNRVQSDFEVRGFRALVRDGTSSGLRTGAYYFRLQFAFTLDPRLIEIGYGGRLMVTYGAGLRVSARGITNAASYEYKPVAPGELLTIFGFGLGSPELQRPALTPDGGSVTRELGGTRVWFDGVAVPVLYTRHDQVSVVAPYSLAGRTSTSVRVEYNGRQAEPVTMPVAASCAGIFTAAASGSGLAAALNEDGSVNGASNPARRGSVVVLYATGEGQTFPGGVDGRIVGASPPKPLLPVKVYFGGTAAEVLYAGGAPGMVSGVLQVNARIQSNAPTGQSPVAIDVGGAESQARVFVQVAATPQAKPRLVGASGFEPPASWSRTRHLYRINQLHGEPPRAIAVHVQEPAQGG